MKKILLTLLVLVVFPGVAFAHPGNTDKYGCHTCRTKCPKWGLRRGEYHCHNSKGLSQLKAPINSKRLY